MAIKPAISLKGLRSSASQTGKTVKTIQSSLNSSAKQKKNLYSSIKILKKRREDRDKRDLLQTQLLAPTLVRSRGGPKSLAITTQQGLSIGDRLIGFLKYATAGWILGNLPTWVALGNRLVGRLRTAGGILSNYGDETLKVLTGITNVFGTAFSNILSFDFLDSSSKLKNSFEDLMTNVDDLGKGILDAFNIIIQPFTNIPPIGSDQLERERQQQEGRRQPQQPSAPSVGGSVGTKEQKSLLDAIAFAEGTRDQPNNGYKTLFGFGQFNDYSRHPDIVVRKNGYASAAAGRYQFMPATFNRLAKKLGLKDFSPESQDKAALELAKELGITQNILSNEGMSARVADKLGDQWASFPGSPFGQPTKSLQSIQKAYQKSLGSPSIQSQPRAGQKPTPAPTGQRRLQTGDIFTKSLGRGVDFIQITSLVGDGRGHGGIDVAAPYGTYISLKVDCEVVAQGEYGNYGLLIDVWVPSLGIQLRMAHLSSVIIKSGKIPAGTSFARVGSSGRVTGPHIHLEYDTRKGTRGGGAINDDPQNYAAKLDQYVRLLFLTNSPIRGKLSGQPRSTVPLLPISPAATTQKEQQAQIDSSYREGLAEGITQERQGRKVVVIDDRSSPIIQQVMAGGGGDGMTFSINESAMLNNFIRNKLLLDLNYV